MHISHIGKYFHPFQGGIESVMRDLMRQQVNAGHAVSAVVHHHDKGESFSEERDNGLAIYRLPLQAVLLFVPISLFSWFYIRKVLKQQSPDLLHLHMPNLSCFWLLLMPSARKIPWVVHWHSDVVGEKPDWRIKLLYPVYAMFERCLLKRAAKIIVTSPNYLHSSQPLRRWRDKCEIVPLGIASTTDNKGADVIDKPAVEAVNKESAVFNILCVGRLTYYKGHRYLLDALAILRENNIRCHVDIVGEGELFETLTSQASRLNISQQVDLHGRLAQSELDRLMQQADVVCLPSIERTEAFGLVLLEAMQYAKPCIVTDVPGSGMSYVVQDKQTGLVVKRADAKALSNALCWLAENPGQCLQMGLAGKQRLHATFSLSAVANKVTTIYRQVIQQP